MTRPNRLCAFALMMVASATTSSCETDCTELLACGPQADLPGTTSGTGGSGGSEEALQCESSNHCEDKHCVDGWCCDTACDDICNRCDSPGTEGTCSPASAGSDPDMDCVGGTCDGSGACARGSFVWSTSHGGDGLQHVGRVVQSPNGYYIGGGNDGSFLMGSEAHEGTSDILVAELDDAGSPLWSRSFGDTSPQILTSVAPLGSGGLVIAGSFAGSIEFGASTLTATSPLDLFVAAMSSTGAVTWATSPSGGGVESVGNIAVDSANAIIIVGSFQGDVSFGGQGLTGAGGNDIFVAKLGPSGDHVWSKAFGDAGSQVARSVAVAEDDSMIVVGHFAGTLDFGGGPLVSMGELDTFMVKLDSNGSHLWSRRVGESDLTNVAQTALDPSGNVFVTGSFNGTIALDGVTLVAAGGQDVFVAKFDPLGSLLWAKAFGNFNDQAGRAVATDSRGNVVFCGGASGSIDFGGGPLASQGGEDAFVAKLAADGTHLWSHLFGGSAAEQRCQGVLVESDDGVVIAGYFDGTMSLGRDALQSVAGIDIFVATLTP